MRKEPDFNLILKWMDRAEKNCRASGRTNSALLWQDARYAIEYLRGNLNTAVNRAIKETTAALNAKWKTAMLETVAGAVLRERDECAKIAEHRDFFEGTTEGSAVAGMIAKEIRARSAGEGKSCP